jgi:hypothetical protein
MTDRTQSGGDTYFCIDTLLRDTEQDFSILTPLGKESYTKYVFVFIIMVVIIITSYVSILIIVIVMIIIIVIMILTTVGVVIIIISIITVISVYPFFLLSLFYFIRY